MTMIQLQYFLLTIKEWAPKETFTRIQHTTPLKMMMILMNKLSWKSKNVMNNLQNQLRFKSLKIKRLQMFKEKRDQPGIEEGRRTPKMHTSPRITMMMIGIEEINKQHIKERVSMMGNKLRPQVSQVKAQLQLNMDQQVSSQLLVLSSQIAQKEIVMMPG